MANWKKLAQGAAGAAGAGGGLNVEDVFSTYLYTGNSSSLGISNGIALGDGVGGGTSTEFDGSSDYLLRTTDFSNTQGSKTFTLSFWVYDNIGKAGTSRTIYYIFDGSTYYSFQVYFLSSDGYLRITGRNSSGTVILDQKITTVVRKKDQWLHVLMSFDLSDSSKRHYAVNDVVGTPSNTTYTNDTIAFSNGSPQHSIAGSFTGGTLHDGNLAHFYMDYTYRDLTVASNRRLFIDANGGSTSPSTLSALNPVIYLPMTDGYSVGENIGTGGDLTAYGSPTVVDSGTEYLSGVGQGGIVWIKNRDQADNHYVFGGESGNNWTKLLTTNSTGYYGGAQNIFDGVGPAGFTIKSDFGGVNTNGEDYASWTFRKAPKFFDVVTYTGNSTAGRTVSHNLGTDVGFMIIKNTTSSGDWICWHRSASTDPGRILKLNTTDAVAFNSAMLNNTNPTSTEFTVGTNYDTNGSGQTYVAYLFAHNDGDGDFGPTGDQDIIKCGSYTYSNGLEIDLGFEPQWLLYKQSSTTGSWRIVDNMRGWGVPSTEKFLYPNLSNAEAAGGQIDLTSTGFKVHDAGTGDYIYIAIRRGPMAVPESATDVFAIDTRYSQNSLPSWQSGFVTDLAISKRTTGSDTYVYDRLRQGKELAANASSSEASASQRNFDHMDGWGEITSASSTEYSWMWKRAPNYFDVVAYTGNGTAGRTVSHNLGVAPEMMWVKGRSIAQNWAVYNPNGRLQLLNQTGAEYSAAVTDDYFGNGSSVIAPTETEFTLGAASPVNNSGDTYIAYLFASLDGISKVGSFSHTNNTTTNVDCGFSSGARFVMIKLSDGSDSWYVWDTTRGINAGTEPLLRLNTNGAEITTNDWIDPLSSGFQITGPDLLTGTYIFYAIA